MKIKLNLSKKEFELFLNTIEFHEPSIKRVLNWVNDEMKRVENGWYNKEESIRQLNHCQTYLDEVKNCNNLFKKLKSNNGKDEVDISDSEYNELLKFIVEQIYHAKNRIEDFSKDRFGWGNDNCHTLINQENSYIKVLNKVFNKYRGENTYNSILDKLQ